MKNKNLFISIIDGIFKLFEWPLIGIFTTIKPFVFFSMYITLGCYYTVFILLYPFRYIFKKIGDSIFKVYRKNEKKKIKLEDIAPNEKINLDSGDEEFKPKEEVPLPLKDTIDTKIKKYFIAKYEDFYFVRKKRERELIARDALIRSLQEENRSDKPITYRYTAINAEGKKETNTFYAFSKMEVYSYLENEHYRVIKIDTSKIIELIYGPKSFGAAKFKNKDLIFWLAQLSTYLKSGIPLTDAVRVLAKQMQKDKNKKRIFDSIIYYLTLGESFSSALAKQNNVFPALLINMIKTAEATGELEVTLDDMTNYYEDVETTRKQMVSAMSYPLIIMVFSICVVAFILLYVIPQFQDVYTSAGAELNAFTLFVLATSEYLQRNILLLVLFAILIILVLILVYKKIKAFKYFIQRYLMKIPLVSKIIIFKEMSIFAKTFSSLLKNNVFITESIGILTSITNNEIYKEIMIQTIANIAKGEKISKSFNNHWAIPDVAYHMIVTGESTGELADMMSRVAYFYQTSHKTIINTMKSFIEPAMIVFLAVIVGGIVMAVILPMFGLYTQIA